jgi:hypothetical protein
LQKSIREQAGNHCGPWRVAMAREAR